MSGEVIAFFVLALVALGGAILMLTLQKVVQMVVSLAFTFISIAGLYVLLEAEFIAVTQVLVYGGAISIIMLFGIMLTKHDDQDVAQRRGQKVFVGVGVALFFLAALYAINTVTWIPHEVVLAEQNTAQIGLTLFSKYVIPFELTSLILLVALIGAVILSKNDEEKSNAKEGEQHE